MTDKSFTNFSDNHDVSQNSIDSEGSLPNDLYHRVIEDFAETNSVRRTAENCHTSAVTAQRILITAGLWSSRSSTRVQELMEQGKNADQIAEEMHLTRDAVYACMPYSRGIYGVEQTKDAQYSKDYRRRMETAEKGMHRNSVASLPDIETMPVDSGLSVSDSKTATTDAGVSALDTETEIAGARLAASASVTEDNSLKLATPRFEAKARKEFAGLVSEDSDFASEDSASVSEEEDTIDMHNSQDSFYVLHLSLVSSFQSGAEESLGLEPEDKEELLCRAKAEHAISRDIIVPGDMSLHALHYAIQRLFGWQNGHLHNYCLSEKNFDRITGGLLGGYTDLCGILFRFPDDDLSDTCWDDDYKKGVSVKTWLRRKYTYSLFHLSVGDSYFGNLWEIEKFRERYPDFSDDTPLKEIHKKVMMDENFNYLTERLTIGELFTLHETVDKTEDVRTWKGRQADRVKQLRELIEKEKEYYNMEEMKESADQLRAWRQSRDQLEEMSWLYEDSYKKQVEREFGEPFDEVLRMNEGQIKLWEGRCMDILWVLNIEATPFFDTIYYRYDYGDDWCIKIEVKEVYHSTEGGDYVGSTGQSVEEELGDVLSEIDTNGCPVCVAADGLNLVDDCGGIYGYLDMLRTIGGKEKEEAADMREWARGLGWTGRKSKPKNML